MRVLARPDRHALALAAQSLADYIACRAFITQHGRVYPITNKAGAVVAFKPYPEVKLANQHLADFHKLAAKFGLTPSDRRSLAVETETASDSSRAKFFATA
jgi:phage terminase small subunit